MIEAFGWGALGASALLIGALVAYRAEETIDVVLEGTDRRRWFFSA